MYFWKNKFISKELQEKINKTIARVSANKLPSMPAGEVKEFVKETELILSASVQAKKAEQKE